VLAELGRAQNQSRPAVGFPLQFNVATDCASISEQ
jgi:hypothetical protein